MKLLVIGLGKGGSRIADEFAQLNKKAKAERNVTILTAAYAACSDGETLEKLISKETDLLVRLLVPEPSSTKPNETVQAISERILSAIRRSEYFDTEAFLVIAGAGGNFGSKMAPLIGQKLKERFVGKPIYSLLVLPFESEELTETEAIYRAAVCLKSLYRVTEAVFLVDNEKLRRGKVSWGQPQINQEIVTFFYDLLCASEVSGSKYAGVRNLSVGDIIQTLYGFTAIGTGKVELTSRFSFWRLPTFREKGEEQLKALEAINLALNNLSIDCGLKDSGKALYLVSAPAKEMSVDMAKALAGRLRELTEVAEIRGGDFAGSTNSVQVTVVLSQLAFVEKVKNYYDKAVAFLKLKR